jgi:threonine dehydratase
VIAGAATAALEIFEDAADTDLLVVPIGGGGLISGAAAVAKAVSAGCAVVGVEVEVSCAFLTSVRAGRLVEIVPGASLADGLGGNPDPDTITFEPIQRLVDQLVTVSEKDLEDALVGLVTGDHVIAEGAGAAAPAALVGKRVNATGRRVVVFVSGANIDRARLAALLA